MVGKVHSTVVLVKVSNFNGHNVPQTKAEFKLGLAVLSPEGTEIFIILPPTKLVVAPPVIEISPN